MTPEVASIIIAGTSLIGVCFTSWMTYVTKRDTREINKSVNNIRPGDKSLYQLAVESGVRLGEVSQRVGALESKLDAHINRPAVCPLQKLQPEICLFPLDS